MSMFHSNTERLIAYWRSRAGDQGLPARADIDPMAFADLLPQAVVAGRVSSGLYPIRLVGGRVADLYGRDLRGHNLLSLFRERDRPLLHTAMETARRRAEPIVAGLDVLADAAILPAEMLLAPLAGAERSPERVLGLFQPLAPLTALDGQPIVELAARAVRSAGSEEEAPHLRLATLDGRRVA